MSHLFSLLFTWKGLLIVFTSHSCLKEGLLSLLLLPVVTLTREQTIPDYILKSWPTSAVPFVPLKRNLYITIPPESVLVPRQCCPTCLPACLGVSTGWLNQLSGGGQWMGKILFLTCWAVFSFLLCSCWHQSEHSLEAGENYRLISLNWVTVGTAGVSVPATGIA